MLMKPCTWKPSGRLSSPSARTTASIASLFEPAGKDTCVGASSPTGKRLLTLGRTLENLRAGLGGSSAVAPASDVVGTMAAAQATHGSARWGTSDEMRQGGHLVEPGKPAGFALARVPDAPAGVDPRFRFSGHVVTVAPTGSGKGIGAVIPNLLDYPGSALVLDVKGENAAVTARARRAISSLVACNAASAGSSVKA